MTDTIEVRHLTKTAVSILEKADEITNKHKNQTGEPTLKDVDTLITDTVFLSELVEDLAEITTNLNKRIMSLEQKAGSLLKALGRDKYESPKGQIEVKKRYAVRMPKDDESKMLLFSYLKERGLFERYATVNVRSLNSYYMAEWEVAKKKDPDAWITFSIPGVSAPVEDEYTKIKSLTKRKRKGNEDDNE